MPVLYVLPVGRVISAVLNVKHAKLEKQHTAILLVILAKIVLLVNIEQVVWLQLLAKIVPLVIIKIQRNKPRVFRAYQGHLRPLPAQLPAIDVGLVNTNQSPMLQYALSSQKDAS